MGFTADTAQFSRALGDLERRTLFGMQTYAQQAAATLESDAKATAPWVDRTGHARGGIRGTSERSGGVIRIALSGSVRYLVYLELAHKKKWAVLWPTMERNKDRILQGFAQIWRA